MGLLVGGAEGTVLYGIAYALQAADELVVVLPFGHDPAVSHRILETVIGDVTPALGRQAA